MKPWKAAKVGTTKIFKKYMFWSKVSSKIILNDIKIPCIPPIIHGKKFVSDFCKKVENSFLPNIA